MITTEVSPAQVLGKLWGIGSDHFLTRRLIHRRIAPDVVMTCDIKPCGNGWTYPTPHGALRFKNADSNAPNKYAWIGAKRDTLLYAFDLREAIQQSGGKVWLTTEFDFFAMRSAGIYHVIAQLQGEGSVPNELPPLLQSLGVVICQIAPDCDDQGSAWSQLVAEKLTPVGIEVYARKLPYPHTKKRGGDIGKLWQEYHDEYPFEQYLFDLPVIKLEVRAEVQSQRTQRNYIISEGQKQQIASALGVTSYSSKGYSKNILCPFHDDTTPSAALHREFGLHCFKCGKRGWKALARVLGLEWEITTPIPAAQMALGDELIQALVADGRSVLAEALERMYRAGWMPRKTFSIKDICALGLPDKRARRVFSQMENKEIDGRKTRCHRTLSKSGSAGLCSTAKQENNSSPDLTPFFFYSKEESNLGKNSPGQPAKLKKLPHPGDLARAYGVRITHYTDIQQKQNLADWRAEVYALQIDRDPGTHPRSELCKPLEISTTTAQAYDKRAGITVTRKYARQQLHNSDGLPYLPELKVTWLETDDGRRFSATKAGYTRAMKHGGRVWKVKQLANHYRRER